LVTGKERDVEEFGAPNGRTHRESQMMRPAGRRGRWEWEAPDGGQIGGVAVGWNNNEPD
jgi:hypothetical protein